MEILTNWPAAGLNSKFSYPRINVSPSVKGDWPCGPAKGMQPQQLR